MKLLNKLKNDRQDLISNLLDNIESLEKLAFEQQAEIERLEKVRQKQAHFLEEERGQKYELLNKIGTAKSEAIKEFAERLKEKVVTQQIHYSYRDIVEVRDIDNLVKEMVGDE